MSVLFSLFSRVPNWVGVLLPFSGQCALAGDGVAVEEGGVCEELAHATARGPIWLIAFARFMPNASAFARGGPFSQKYFSDLSSTPSRPPSLRNRNEDKVSQPLPLEGRLRALLSGRCRNAPG